MSIPPKSHGSIPPDLRQNPESTWIIQRIIISETIDMAAHTCYNKIGEL
jgi:hypothetical protein